MKNNHIIEILDNAPLRDLTEAQLVAVRTHVEGCSDCAGAYKAATIASHMAHARATIEIEPSPFFATRVIARVRAQQAENVPVMLRLWRSANYLVSSMAITTAALAVFSFVIPPPATNFPETTATVYSAESVILGDEEELTYDQVLSTIYAEEEEAR